MISKDMQQLSVRLYATDAETPYRSVFSPIAGELLVGRGQGGHEWKTFRCVRYR